MFSAYIFIYTGGKINLAYVIQFICVLFMLSRCSVWCVYSNARTCFLPLVIRDFISQFYLCCV